MAVSETVRKLKESITKGKVINFTFYGPEAKTVYLSGNMNYPPLNRNSSGCSVGFFTVPDSVYSSYLPARNFGLFRP